jgi:hypothetical protein
MRSAANSAGSSEGQEDETPVVFARVENLLPALSRRMEEARRVLAREDAAPGSAKALAQCSIVHELSQARFPDMSPRTCMNMHWVMVGGLRT